MENVNEGEIVYFEDAHKLESMGLEIDKKDEHQEVPKEKEKKKKSKKEENEEEEDDESQSVLHPHRYYENELPEVGDIVMCRIDHCQEYCAVVNLLEYNNVQGIIQFSEISAKRIREAPHKILRPGKKEVLQVIRVDAAKKYIDLTRKNISSDETQECYELYAKGKHVHGIVSHVVDVVKSITIEEVYNNIVWPLTEQHEHAFNVFKEIAIKNEDLFGLVQMDDLVKKELVKTIKHRLAPKMVKVEARIEVTCFTHEGIDAIISAFKIAKESHPEVEISIESPPMYLLSIITKERQYGVELILSSIEKIKNSIVSKKGSLVVKKEPDVSAIA